MADFHFIRPLWLLAIFALILALYLLKKYRIKQSGWHQLLPKHLSTVLVEQKTQSKPMSLVLPFIIGLLAIVAIAGPTWQKLPQPVYQLNKGSVLIMDMSYSMYSTDISPNRLTRTRYKAIDLLETINEGEIGLVAYAGDAFVISPLTEDINNIKLLLPSLSPDLMPELGSNPFSALTLAQEMLMNAGHIEGDIYWFTDGIDNEDIQDITDWSRGNKYRLNILGVGSLNGAPIKLTNGELMKDNNGAIIVPKLTEDALSTTASTGRGRYVRITNNNSDIDSLTSPMNQLNQQNNEQQESTNTGDQWQEAGPYLVLLLLPLVLGYFRRGALLTLLPFMLITTPKDAHADIWQNLWKTSDQQAQEKYNNNAFAEAAKQFKDPLWQGSAHYKAGNYQDALTAFETNDSAQSWYNRGNAYAKMNKLDEAIKAYEQALVKQPNLADAQKNKEIIEQLKKQQEEQEQQQENNQDKENQDDQEAQDQQNQNNQENSQQNDEQNSENNQQNQDQQDQSQSSPSPEEQSGDEEQEQDAQQSEQNKQEQEEKQKEQQAQQAKEQAEQEAKEQTSSAQQAAQQLDKETEEKHQQLLNKVTDDPYLLLRNKMKLEYQKRRHNQNRTGDSKKW